MRLSAAVGVACCVVLALAPRAAQAWDPDGVVVPEPPDTRAGSAVAVSGDTIAIAAGYVIAATPSPSDEVYVMRRTASGWSREARLVSSELDQFGYAVALAGDTLAIGAPDQVGPGCRGRVYVLERSAGAWRETTRIDCVPGEWWLGRAVALSGDTLVASAPDNGPGYPGDCWEFGVVDVWVRDGAGWREQYRVPPTTCYFGEQLALDGDTLVVGNEVYARSGATWAHVASLFTMSRPASVAVSGSWAVLGTPDDHGLGLYAGSARLFVRTDAGWMAAVTLRASDVQASAWFGQAVALDGDVLVVGAYLANAARSGSPGDGAAYVFERRPAGWTEAAVLRPLPTGDGPGFGTSVAVGGATVLVGAPGRPDIAQPGAVYIYRDATRADGGTRDAGRPDAAGRAAAAPDADARVDAARDTDARLDAAPDADAPPRATGCACAVAARTRDATRPILAAAVLALVALRRRRSTARTVAGPGAGPARRSTRRVRCTASDHDLARCARHGTAAVALASWLAACQGPVNPPRDGDLAPPDAGELAELPALDTGPARDGGAYAGPPVVLATAMTGTRGRLLGIDPSTRVVTELHGWDTASIPADFIGLAASGGYVFAYRSRQIDVFEAGQWSAPVRTWTYGAASHVDAVAWCGGRLWAGGVDGPSLAALDFDTGRPVAAVAIAALQAGADAIAALVPTSRGLLAAVVHGVDPGRLVLLDCASGAVRGAWPLASEPRLTNAPSRAPGAWIVQRESTTSDRTTVRLLNLASGALEPALALADSAGSSFSPPADDGAGSLALGETLPSGGTIWSARARCVDLTAGTSAHSAELACTGLHHALFVGDEVWALASPCYHGASASGRFVRFARGSCAARDDVALGGIVTAMLALPAR